MRGFDMKTQIVNDKTIDRKWLLVDAEGQTLGRIASEIARLLTGKHKPSVSPSVDVGDNVVVVNAEKIVLSGKKAQQKQYFHPSTFPGNSYFESFEHALEKDGTTPLKRAIRGMVPKTALGDRMMKKLFIYRDTEHPHAAQQPETISL
jgi:large subunit ribosomal protein L13